MNSSDHISERLETIFWVKNTNYFLRIRDPGGIFLTLDPGSGTNMPDPQHCLKEAAVRKSHKCTFRCASVNLRDQLERISYNVGV